MIMMIDEDEGGELVARDSEEGRGLVVFVSSWVFGYVFTVRHSR